MYVVKVYSLLAYQHSAESLQFRSLRAFDQLISASETNFIVRAFIGMMSQVSQAVKPFAPTAIHDSWTTSELLNFVTDVPFC